MTKFFARREIIRSKNEEHSNVELRSRDVACNVSTIRLFVVLNSFKSFLLSEVALKEPNMNNPRRQPGVVINNDCKLQRSVTPNHITPFQGLISVC